MAPSAAQPVYAATPAAAGAPRYLAPVPPTVVGTGAANLNPSLPPQAYRGPTSRGGTGDAGPPTQNPYRRDGARTYDGAPVERDRAGSRRRRGRPARPAVSGRRELIRFPQDRLAIHETNSRGGAEIICKPRRPQCLRGFALSAPVAGGKPSMPRKT